VDSSSFTTATSSSSSSPSPTFFASSGSLIVAVLRFRSLQGGPTVTDLRQQMGMAVVFAVVWWIACEAQTTDRHFDALHSRDITGYSPRHDGIYIAVRNQGQAEKLAMVKERVYALV
jgi:hypothetical protein